MIVVVMGVSGSGKSTIGANLAMAINADFAEGDQYHPPENIQKMQNGQPLTDDDRKPWLVKMAAEIERWQQESRRVVLACSALKQDYRNLLKIQPPNVYLVYLRGTYDTIAMRMNGRNGHFMPTSLLKSQFETLEEPQNAIIADVALSVPAIVEKITTQLHSLIKVY